jgi:hypothetical protein
MLVRDGGPLGRALQSEGAGYAGAENPDLVMPNVGTVPNEAGPRLGEKNYPDPSALEVGNAAQTLASLLRDQMTMDEQGASSLKRSSLRYDAVVIVRVHHGGELIGVAGIRDSSGIHSNLLSSSMNSYLPGNDDFCPPPTFVQRWGRWGRSVLYFGDYFGIRILIGRWRG